MESIKIRNTTVTLDGAIKIESQVSDVHSESVYMSQSDFEEILKEIIELCLYSHNGVKVVPK